MRDFSEQLVETRKRLADAAVYLKVEELRARRPLLETEASRPDLWDDPDAARRVTGELSRRRRRPRAATSGSSRQLEDAETLHELAREVDDASRSRRSRRRSRRSTASCGPSSCARCSPASTTSATRCARSRRARAAPTPRTGPRCSTACTSAGPSAAGFDGRGGVVHAGLGGGPVLGRVPREGPLRLRLPAGRARRAPPRPHEPVQRAGQAPDGLRRAPGRADAPRGRRADRDRRGRHQDGRLPRLRRRRPAHQQDLLGRAPHPPAHRHRRVLPDRALPAPEPGQGHGRCSRPSWPRRSA